MKKIIGVFIVILYTVSIYSQFPEMIGYQAIVRDIDNQLVANTQVGMQISILEGSASGTTVYVETHTPTTNVNGLVSIEIGKGVVTFGEFANINWASGTMFIKSETDPAGGENYTIATTSQLVSVPYAFHAKTAESVILANVLQAPSGNNQEATEIQSYAATLNAIVNANGLMTTVMFEWGLTTEYGYTASAIPDFVKGYEDIPVALHITGLQANSTYHYRIKAVNAVDIFVSEDMSFITPITVAQVTTAYVQNILAFSATSGGSISSDGGSAVISRGVCWSTSPNPTITDNKTSDGGGTGVFTSTVSDLTPNTRYYLRSYATNTVGTSYGNELSFTTLSGEIDLTTQPVSNILAFSATSGGSISSDGGSPVIDRGVCWSTSPNPTITDNKTSDESGTGVFTSTVSDLSPNTRYYLRSYATNTVGTSYGNELSFTTQSGIVNLTTQSASNILAFSATSGGSISSDGGSPVISRGVCWSTSPNPTITDNKTSDGNGTGVFTSTLSDLTPNTRYYLRSYATNAVGTSYGDELSFTTQSGIVNLTTQSASDILAFSATSGGNISSDGGTLITARGVCWSTSPNPTITDNKISDGSGTGVFTFTLSDLSAGTTYYVRAYITNEVGTSYGDEVSFTTLYVDGTTGTVTYNGYTYKTVYIANREWFAENLRTTKYNNNTDIPLVTDDNEWNNLTTPAYCWYNNDQSTYGNTYGALYNWYTVNTGELCPDGWHVPTDDEWIELKDYVHGVTFSLKEVGTEHWESPNYAASDDFGFTALPGGMRPNVFLNIGSHGYWWSATEDTTTDVEKSWSIIFQDSPTIRRVGFSKERGLSVRCIKDK